MRNLRDGVPVLRTAIIILTLVLLISTAVFADKKVSVSESSFNFGKTVQHVTIIHDFWIKSVGDETVRITKVIPGCGCTQIPLTDSVIAPGDSTSLRIILDTQAFRGRINKNPSFETDADTAPFKLKLFAEIVTEPASARPLRLNPVELDVSQFSKKTRRRGKLIISNRSGQDFAITPVDTTNRSFAIRLPAIIPAGDSAEVFVVVHKEAVETDFKESITFEAVSETTRQRYTIPVIRLYKPDKR